MKLDIDLTSRDKEPDPLYEIALLSKHDRNDYVEMSLAFEKVIVNKNGVATSVLFRHPNGNEEFIGVNIVRRDIHENFYIPYWLAYKII